MSKSCRTWPKKKIYILMKWILFTTYCRFRTVPAKYERRRSFSSHISSSIARQHIWASAPIFGFADAFGSILHTMLAVPRLLWAMTPRFYFVCWSRIPGPPLTPFISDFHFLYLAARPFDLHATSRCPRHFSHLLRSRHGKSRWTSTADFTSLQPITLSFWYNIYVSWSQQTI